MKRYIVLIFLIILVLVLAVLWWKSPAITQVVQFNHLKHKEMGLSCEDCHKYFNSERFSSLPNLEICAGCHSEPQGESEEEAKLVKLIDQGKEIEWQRIYKVPGDVFFSHRVHVKSGKLECKVCHGNIGESTKPPQRPRVKLKMGFCMNCHKDMKVSNDCITCHI